MRTKRFVYSILGIFIVFTGVLSVAAIAEDRRQDPSQLVIMTLNAEFLWDGVSPEEGQGNFQWKNSQSEAEAHMQDVAEIIIQSDPDMVNLVEVENKKALQTFNQNFLAGRGYEPYLIKGKDTFTGQDVALLTRIDPESNRIHRYNGKGQSGTVSKGVSKNYFSKFSVNGESIALVGLHFLAFPNRSDRRFKREAQADAIRDLGMSLQDDGFSLVILGDFNDYDGKLDSLDHIDSTPITNVLQIVRGLDPNDPNDDLTNAVSLAPKGERFTAFWDANRNGQVDPPDEHTAIDHILLSSNLAQRVDGVDIPHDHDPRSVTDHYPVVVRLQMNSALPSTGSVRMIRLIPNPDGNENHNESVTLKNVGTGTVDMAGWQLRDLAGRNWDLSGMGTMNSGQEKIVTRDGQPMAMNNGGDTIDLINHTGAIVQTVTYDRVEENEEVVPVP